MAEVVVHTGNHDIQVLIKYTLSADSSNRTWSLSADLYVRVPSNFNIGPWGKYGNNTGNLVGGAIGNISTGDHKLAGPYTTSGNYNDNGDAPSVTITWAWNVNSSWGGCVYPHGSTTVTGSSIGSAAIWNDINAYQPDGSTQNGLIFNLTTSDGGSWSNITNEPSSFTKKKGTTATISNIRTNVTGAHYTSNNVTNSGASSFTWTFSTADWACCLYSAWNTYTVAYNANGGTGTTNSSSHVYNTAKNLTANGFSRTYYTWNGWNTAANGSGTSYSNKASVKNLTSTQNGTVTLYAQWSPNPPINLSFSRTGSDTTSISLKLSAEGVTMTNYKVYYRANSTGSYSVKDFGSSATGSITGLAVDTNYQIYFIATNAGGTTTSGTQVFSTTLTNPTITAPTKSKLLPFWCTITATGSITPSRTLTYRFSKDDGATWTAYQSSNVYKWEDLTPETTYKMKVQVNAAHVGANASDTSVVSSALSVTTPTNQYRGRIKKDGEWKKGRIYLKKDNEWKKAVGAYIKINDQWVECKNFYEGEYPWG